MSSKLENLKKQLAQMEKEAVREVNRIHLDQAIRAIVSAANPGQTNRYSALDYKNEMLTLSATFDAGTNSASVTYKGTKIYEAHNYGETLCKFRDGDWVTVVLEAAAKAIEKVEEEKEAREIKELESFIQNFLPLE